MKKYVSLVLVIIMIAACVMVSSSCGDMTGGAVAVGYDFCAAICDGRYDKAFDLCYAGSDDLGDKESFAQRYKNIYEALQITDTELASREVKEIEDSECFSLNYTVDFKSDLLGDFSHEYQAMIMPDVRGYSIMYDPSLILPYMQAGDSVRVKTLKGRRGEIFTSDRELLAQDSYAQSVCVTVEGLEDSVATVAAQLSGIIDEDASAIAEKINKAEENGQELVVVKKLMRDTLDEETIARIEQIKGVTVDDTSVSPLRYYPHMDAAAHIVGYVTPATAEDIEKDPTIQKDDVVGKSGLEFTYDGMLRGKDGKKIYVADSLGQERYVIYEQPSQDGADITLTLDSALQDKTYTILATYLKEGQSGCAIVMDYNTAAVEAAVSYPGFDPNWFTISMDPDVWEYLMDEESGYPLVNRVTQSVYPPGSTFKVFTCVPALENKLLTADQEVFLDIEENKWTPPESLVGNKWTFPPIVRAEPTKGDVYNLINALKSSDNIFFSYVAILEGEDMFMDYMDRIGIDGCIDFDLPVTPSSFKSNATEMSLHLLATSGYGMGEIQTTPLQLASMYTCFMNNGDILNPYIIKSIEKTENGEYRTTYEGKTTKYRENIMKQETIDTLKGAMKQVVETGTAYQLGLKNLDIIGKTGTATLKSTGASSREVNWIILLSRVEGDEKLVLVMVDSRADEGDNKFDIARELIKPYGYSEGKEYGGEDDDTESE